MLGYFGPAGTFTHQALRTINADDAVAFASVREALDAVRLGEVRGAVVPIENSVEGGVSATLDELIAEDEESRVRHDLLVSAMDALNDREKHILTERRLSDEPQTLEELSQVYNVSRERVRQIEVRAFEKLQKAMQRIASERLVPAGA